MVKVAISPASWQSVVNAARANSAAIKEAEVQTLSKNNLSRLKAYEGIEAKANSVIASFKSLMQDRTMQMINAGDRVVEEDQTMAGKIDQNTAQIR